MQRTSEAKPVNKSIEGYVQLKRKSSWVRRYAKVENQIFSYKKSRDDRKARGFIDLRHAKVKYSGKPEMESSFIQIKTNVDTIILSYESFTEYQKWENCFSFQYQQYNEEQDLRDTFKAQQTKMPEITNSSIPVRESYKMHASQKSSVSKIFRSDLLTDFELKQAKGRLEKESKKQWSLIDGKEGILVYSDKKSLNLSKTKGELDHIRRTQAMSENQISSLKLNIIMLISIFIILVGIDASFGNNPHYNVSGFKYIIELALFGYLAKMLQSVYAPDNSDKQGDLSLKEEFNIKATICLLASPEDIANALIDDSYRDQWDPNINKIFKPSENQLRITYQSSSDENIGLQEHLKYQFVYDTKQGGTYFIQEQVNDSYFRYYELQPVQNKPYFMRVIFYTPVNSVTFKTRGKDIYRAISNLKNYISQANGEKSLALVLKKTGSNQDDSELMASVANIGFDYLHNGNQQQLSGSEGSDESDQEEDSQQKNKERQEEESKSVSLLNASFINMSVELPLKTISCITDWESLMPKYKSEHQVYIRQGIQQIQGYDEKLVHPDWKESVDDKKAGLVIWQRTTPENLRAMKAFGIINRRPIDIFKTIGNDNYRKEYDSNLDFGSYLEKIGDQTYFIYQKSKKISFVASRDFIMILHFNMTPQGAIYIMAFSVDKNELIPQEKGVIRGWINIGGWKLDPVGDDKTQVTYMIELDLKGSIPGFVMVQANKEQGYQVVKMRKTVEKFLKENNY